MAVWPESSSICDMGNPIEIYIGIFVVQVVCEL